MSKVLFSAAMVLAMVGSAYASNFEPWPEGHSPVVSQAFEPWPDGDASIQVVVFEPWPDDAQTASL